MTPHTPTVRDCDGTVRGTIARLADGRFKARRVGEARYPRYFFVRQSAVEWILAGVTDRLPMEVSR